MSPEVALIEAVTARLALSGDLTAIVGDKILDEVPNDRSPVTAPYVYAGPAGRQRVPDTDYPVWTLRLRLYVASTGFGRRQTWDIADAIARALNHVELDLADPFLAVGPAIITLGGDIIAPPSPKSAFVDLEVIVQDTREDT